MAADLRQLRRQAGNPGYRELSKRVGFSAATLASAAAGRQLPTLAVTQAFVRAVGGDPAVWERRWRQVSAEVAAHRAGTVSPAGHNGHHEPYLGLRHYDAEDADWFFGRHEIVARLVDLLDQRRLVAVFGVSGSGKSSLLRAGLVPALRDRYRPVVLTPGDQPVPRLRAALGAVPGDADTLVVVDQFEELLTHDRDPHSRGAFVAALAELTADAAGRTRVVIGVRADFYPHCAGIPLLAGLLAGANAPVGSLTEAELREVITKPARLAGLTVERALETQILADVGDEPGALPLVSHALLETWRLRRGNILTVAGYRAAGGISGAIAQTAETVFDRLDPARQTTVRDVLVRLVTLGEGVGDTRRRVPRVELDFPGVAQVLEALAAARLVVLDRDTVELAHEALIRAWPRLHDWLHADRERLHRHRQLTEDAGYWLAHDRDPDALYRGVRLAAWDRSDPAGTGGGTLNASEQAFLAASRERAAGELRTERRRVRATLTALTAGVVVLGILAGLALLQTRRANRERDLALTRQLVATARAQLDIDQEVALLLAMRAYDLEPTDEAQAVLRQATAASRIRAVEPSGQGQVFGLAFSPDGRTLATSGDDGSVHLRAWAGPGSPGGPPRVLRGHTGYVWSPTFSPDGRWLATAGYDHVITVWDLATDAMTMTLRGHTDRVQQVAFSPDGKRLASASADGTIGIWRRADGATPTLIRVEDHPLGVAFSPDGRLLAAATRAGTILVWDAATLTTPLVLSGHEGSVASVRFSPDGQRLASAGSDGTVRIWTLGGKAPPIVLRADDGYLETAVFSPDGSRVASTHSGSNTVRVWSTSGPRDPLVLRGHDGPVWAATFSPDGRWLLTGSTDGTLRTWDPSYPGQPTVLRGHDQIVYDVAVRADGKQLASAGADGTVRLWDPGGTGDAAVLRGHSAAVMAVAFAPDGRRVVSGGNDGSVRLWDVDRREPATAVLTGHDGNVMDVAYHPDGTLIASGGSDGTLRIWRTDRPAPPIVRQAHEGGVQAVAFSADGRRVVTTGEGGAIRSWPIDNGPSASVETQPPGLLWCLAFSTDGLRLAVGGHDGQLQIWNADRLDATGGLDQPVTLRGHRDAVWTAAFSPDDRILISAGQDRAGLRVWRTDTGTELLVIAGHQASTITARILPDGRFLAAYGDGTLRIWRCAECGPIADVRALADTRVTRTLTEDERATYLDGGTS